MMPKEDELLLDTQEHQDRVEPQKIEQHLLVEIQPPFSFQSVLNFDTLKRLDNDKLEKHPEQLRPILTELIEASAQHFDPVRFRFIEALAEKALQQRVSVARIIEQKALQALSDYLRDYLSARKRTASLASQMILESPEAENTIGRLFDAGDLKGIEKIATQTSQSDNKKQGLLADLTQEMFQHNESRTFSAQPSFEDELRQQEQELMHSISDITRDKKSETGSDQRQDGSGELSAMRYFRQSLVKRNSEQVVTHAIQEGPENPGPLNQQALIIRSLSIMQALSPSYSTRFVSYMDTLLWLEKAGGAKTPAKSKGSGRRKS